MNNVRYIPVFVFFILGCAMAIDKQKESRVALNAERQIKVRYKNWRGETAIRTIIPIEIFWGATSYHPQEQWLLKVWDIDRADYRDYALYDIIEWL